MVDGKQPPQERLLVHKFSKNVQTGRAQILVPHLFINNSIVPEKALIYMLTTKGLTCIIYIIILI